MSFKVLKIQFRTESERFNKSDLDLILENQSRCLYSYEIGAAGMNILFV